VYRLRYRFYSFSVPCFLALTIAANFSTSPFLIFVALYLAIPPIIGGITTPTGPAKPRPNILGVESNYESGGPLQGLLGAVQGIGSALGPIGSAVSAAATLAPLVAQLFAKPDKTVVSGSPGMYQAGGDIPLSQGAFQVKGNPNTVDGNAYPHLNANLDHDEVVTTTQQGQKFVFSADLKDPITGKAFSELAAPQERAKGKAEKVLKSNPYDEQAKSTISMSNAALNNISNIQETVATALGHRNRDGSTKQSYQAGGYIDLGDNYFFDPTTKKYFNQAASKEYSEVVPNNYVRGLKQAYDARNAPYNPNF